MATDNDRRFPMSDPEIQKRVLQYVMSRATPTAPVSSAPSGTLCGSARGP
jgi:hypothetical protein